MSEPENAPAAPPEGDLSAEDWRAVAYDLTGPDRPMVECDVERLAALLASLRAALAAATAPPEGEAEAILRRKEVRQPCSGKRGDGPWVLVEPAIYLSVTERDTVLAALAAATARADEDEAGRLRWEQEAERLRGERADLQHKLAHWQRVAEESGTMVARRVEAMREAAAVHTQEYLVSCGVTDACDVAEEVADAIRALPAPSPGPSAEDAPDEMEPEEYAAYIQRTARAPGGQDVR